MQAAVNAAAAFAAAEQAKLKKEKLLINFVKKETLLLLLQNKLSSLAFAKKDKPLLQSKLLLLACTKSMKLRSLRYAYS